MNIGTEREAFAKGQEEVERPKFVKDEHLEFLDELRESGVTNMFGASPYLQKVYNMKKENAIETLFLLDENFL